MLPSTSWSYGCLSFWFPHLYPSFLLSPMRATFLGSVSLLGLRAYIGFLWTLLIEAAMFVVNPINDGCTEVWNRVKCRISVNVALLRTGNYLTSWATVSFPRFFNLSDDVKSRIRFIKIHKLLHPSTRCFGLPSLIHNLTLYIRSADRFS